eukprot:gene8534-6151_t
MPLGNAIGNAPTLSSSIGAVVAPDPADVPRLALTLRDATDEDAPPDTCDTAGKREVFKRFCALLCEHIRKFETRRGAVLPSEEQGTVEFLRISPQILNASVVIFTTYQYTAAPAYIVDYIQRQDVPFGQGNGRIPLYRLMGFSSAEEVAQYCPFSQLFKRVGIYVEVHHLRFETRDVTVVFTCEIKRYDLFCDTLQGINAQPVDDNADVGGWTLVAEWQMEEGDGEMRRNTTNTLSVTAVNDETKVLVAEADAIRPLVGLVTDGDVDVRPYEAGALMHIADKEENKVLVAEAGAIVPLVRLLDDGDVEVRRKETGSLMTIADNDENQVLVAEAPLVGLLGDGDFEVNASSFAASRERTIITNLSSRRVSEPKPVFNNIVRAMDYKTRIRYDEATTNTTPGERPFYDILSIDGGGIRGILPACLLSEVERRARYPIHKLVDLQAGTSTGALVAAALATNQRTGARPMTAGDIVTLYANPEYHKHIFTRSLTMFGIFGPKYLANRAYMFLDVLGGQTFRDTLNDLLVVAVDEANDTAPHCFSSFDELTYSHHVKLVDVLMASSATPTYFPPHDININGVSHRFVDGGVQANNPASLAVSLAMGRRSIPSEKIRVWSLGTGDVIPDPDVKHSRDVNNGTLYWISKAHAVAMAGQQGTVDLNLKNQLGNRYNRWQVWMDQPYRMDDYQQDTIGALTDTALGFIEENDDMITAAVNALLVNRGFERCN